MRLCKHDRVELDYMESVVGRVELTNITHIVSEDKYTFVHSTTHPTFMLHCSVKDLERFYKHRFVRIAYGCIVNASRLRYVMPNDDGWMCAYVLGLSKPLLCSRNEGDRLHLGYNKPGCGATKWAERVLLANFIRKKATRGWKTSWIADYLDVSERHVDRVRAELRQWGLI